MQFAVPQFTDVEDKLIGPLTLKQFLVLLAAGGLDMMFYSIFDLNVIFFALALPVSFLGLILAFGKFNGRSILEYVGAFLAFFFKPQVRIFKREDVNVTISFKTEKKAEPLVTNPKDEEPSESRLKKLAYLLDQKTAEEKELLEKNNG